MADENVRQKKVGWKLGSRRSGLPSNQCTKCLQCLPEEAFYVVKRRGRVERRQVCRDCWRVNVKSYQQGDTYKEYAREKRALPEQKEYHLGASRKFRAKPEYKEIEREQYRKAVARPEGRERVRVKVRRRRARIRGSLRHHSVRDVMICVEVQQGLCFYCDVDIKENYTVDHLVPLVRGGSDGPENIVIACASCNFRKSDKTPEEFAAGIKHGRLKWKLSQNT